MRRLTSLLGRRTALLIACAILLTFGLLEGELFLGARNLENITRQVSLDAPIVFGQLVVLVAGGIDISVGSTMAMSAALAIGLQPYGTGVAILGALLFGLGVGVVNGLLVTRGKIVPFVATLGTMSVVRGLLLTYTGQQPMSGSDPSFAFLGGGNIGPVPTPLVITLALLFVLSVFLERTRRGRDLYAIGGSPEAAFLAGVAVGRGLMIAFMISGLMAAISGVLVASRINSASVQLGADTPLLAISAALIGGASLLGGKGSVVASFIGVLALGMLANGMNLLGVPTYNQIAIRALILVAVVTLDALATRIERRGLTMSRIAN
ncbi:MAG: ABC transporter permease [Rhizobiales bacterium]|nr:ABC transporter permease [Hyphomicrobiales bacterium]